VHSNCECDHQTQEALLYAYMQLGATPGCCCCCRCQIFISYNPSDDESPHCSWRWLLEYGFTIQQQPRSPATAAAADDDDGPAAQQQQQQQQQRGSADPRRQCHAFNLTAGEVLQQCLASCPRAAPAAAAAAATSAAASSDSRDSQQQRQPLLAAAGLEDSSVWLELDGTGRLPEGVVSWVQQLLTAAAQQGRTEQQGSKEQPAGEAGELAHCGCGCGAAAAAGKSEQSSSSADLGSSKAGEIASACEALCVLRRVLQQRREELQKALAAVGQQQQQQQQREAQSCPADATASTLPAAATADARKRTDSCPPSQLGSVGGSSSSESSAESGCPLEGLLSVAWDGDAALAATADGLQEGV
jgi:hypothetical protein